MSRFERLQKLNISNILADDYIDVNWQPIQQLVHLKELVLQHIYGTHIGRQIAVLLMTLSLIQSIEKIRIVSADIDIGAIEEIGNFINLKELDFEDINLSSAHFDAIGKLGQLRKLEVCISESNTNIYTLVFDLLAHLPLLTALHLRLGKDKDARKLFLMELRKGLMHRNLNISVSQSSECWD